MKALRKLLDKIKPAFEKGGKLSMFHSVFDGFETFLFVPNRTSQSGTHIHDSIDSKRAMFVVVIALIPALLFGMFNVGYQHYLAIGQAAGFFQTFFWGALAVLPYIVVSYVVGLGIEFTIAQFRGEEIHEGFLVTGMLIPLIIPINTPLWMVALATAFAVIFVKEIFGGTGYNIFNVALMARAFLFFAYPSKMSGDSVWVSLKDYFGFGQEQATIDVYTGATPLGQAAIAGGDNLVLTGITGEPLSWWDTFLGLIPGSIGETSVLAILLGGILLIYTGIASWKIILSVFAGGAFMAILLNIFAVNPYMEMPFWEHWCLGGFAFGAFFMATDPVTASRTEKGKWIYGFLIGLLAILYRVLNPAYPEGMMLAILFMNIFAKFIDYLVVQNNIKKRLKRARIAQ
ncbi:MAG: NADH:ubiquinone reductase (Na(+)-transporting) subunit B [Bacteroidales bacterium]|nr:NADH:ubiquinone reductase (Na(+)-transporting) subunit B [Bacteroidales bacterium]MDI9544348.1 NADH:ubiquinone reductase (Na(+)-transporting) subunit B [Bacteroidota bacterium]OQC02501.1 MAG: Na(+)-translocating NADH-quinone reductase subunit B [Bacteroidetes bacterium ADurb.Bin090]MBP8982519.1 NADH:ubiquinone reductase (Na(+)-transporting) subunit B [Bacteroidales bacterium]HNZ80965.1 NADH:ubiquinone reductase (Na(+)-transporting) subunit B [Bacteroidales bacterium]